MTGLTPIIIKLREIVSAYKITRGCDSANILMHTVIEFKNWPHPADAVTINSSNESKVYTVQAYTDGSKHNNGVGSGIALFINGELKYQMQYKLGIRCSNNQAEQLAILKALEKIEELNYITFNMRAAIYTNSRVTLDSLKKS